MPGERRLASITGTARAAAAPVGHLIAVHSRVESDRSPFDSGPLRGPTLRANGISRPVILSVAARSAAESKDDR